MVDIIETLYEMEGVGTSPAAERAQKLFEQLDINDDGHLDKIILDNLKKNCLRFVILFNKILLTIQL